MAGKSDQLPRIAQLIDTLQPGGAERMAVNLANTFSKKGISHILLVSRDLGSLKDQISDRSALKLLEKKSTFDSKAFKKLLAELDEFGADILHAHGPSIYWGVLAKFLRPSIKLFWHDHLGISPSVIKENPRKEIKWIARWIDSVITANESTREHWLEKKNWRESKVTYLPNYPSLEPFSSKKDSTFTFLHLANYRNEKGHFHLIQAAEKLMAKGLDFRIRMVGKDVDSQWKKAVLTAVKEGGLLEKVSVESECHNVSKLISEVDAGLVTSDREGLPVALLEYGLGKLPVISSDVGQCPEVLKNGKFGLIFPQGNVEALADSMEKMVLNPVKFVELGRLYGRHVLENYGEDQFFRGYEKLLQL